MRAKVFLITPFTPSRAGGEDPGTFAAVQEAVAQAAELAESDLVHPARLQAAGVIMDQVRQAIAEADVVVAIITGENPNVYLEIGTALSTAKRPVVFVRDVVTDIPFDIRHHRVLTYGGAGELETLPANLAKALRETFAAAPRNSTSSRGPEDLADVRHLLTTLIEEWRARSTPRVSRAIIDYSAYVADKTQGFTGRQFVFDAVDRFIADSKAGYLLVRGDPGIGKTAIMAELVRRRGYAHHFNILAEGLTRPVQFFANACAQLIARHALDDVRLPDDSGLSTDTLRKTMSRAAATAGPDGLVLLVDALDEASRETAHNPLLLPFSLPEGCRVIATTRRTAQELEIRADSVTPLELVASSPENLVDVRAHLAAVASRPIVKRWLEASGRTETEFIETLERKSEGNFMYLRHVLPAFERREPGGADRLEIDNLPQGLRGYYEQHWLKMRGEDFDMFVRVYQKIVAVLATARQPVRKSLIARASGLGLAEVSWTIDRWREFLSETPDPTGALYRIYHASYRDFLAEKTVA